MCAKIEILTAVDLVRPIKTVRPAVALPGAVHALAAGAVELQRRAGRSGGGPRPRGAVLRPLVRAVGAVGVAVARPQTRHALGVVALEGAGAAGGRRAGGLVAAVFAVVLLVAHEG